MFDKYPNQDRRILTLHMNTHHLMWSADHLTDNQKSLFNWRKNENKTFKSVSYVRPPAGPLDRP